MNQKLTESPIDEIHRTRREISERFGGDVTAIAEDAARRQAASNRPVWRPKTTSNAMQPSVSVTAPAIGQSAHAAG